MKFAPVISNLGKVKLNPQPYNMYQCVYVCVHILDQLRILRKNLGVDSDPRFEPHLSLVYGKLSIEEKNYLVHMLGEDLFLNDPPIKWDKLVLVYTDNQEGDFPWTKWKIIEQYELTGKDQMYSK